MKLYKEMKRYMTKYLALTGGLLMLAGLSGCQLEAPEIPAEELYIRGFIKQYGLIDPTQDFSSAMQTNVTLSLPGRASVVNVYAVMGDDLYRVGCFAELEGTVSLPVDVSEATETIVVDVDGVRYYTTPGGTVDVKSGKRAASRAGNARVSDNIDPLSLWINPGSWATETAKNGETEASYGARQPIIINEGGSLGGAVKTVDGVTYFDVSTAAHIYGNLTGDKSNTTALNVNAGDLNPGEIGNTANGSNVRFLIQNKDDVLSAYSFTFRTASKNNANVRVILLGQHTTAGETGNDVYVFMDSKNLAVEEKFGTKEEVTTSDKLNVKDKNGNITEVKNDKYTEWEVRTEMMPRGWYELIIIGMDSEANVDGDKTCGNWGFMKMQRIKTATDMRWILACEDLGTTDDFDFNDVVFSIEAVNTNTAAMKLGVIQWQVVENPTDGIVIRPKAPSRAGTVPANSANTTKVKVTALAAGGTLPIWLHFREEESHTETTSTGTDYIVCPSSNDGDRGCLIEATEVFADKEKAAEKAGEGVTGCSEWHRWFNQYSSKNMLNTGVTGHISNTKSVTFYTKNVFSLENFCYLKFNSGSTDGDLPYYFDSDSKLDPWTQKVLQWEWQQRHSQEVTFGFFLTVYEPLVSGSSKDITDKRAGEKDKDMTVSHLLSKSLDGLPPQMFLIPDCNSLKGTGYAGNDFGWCWPCERVKILDVYPNFKAWSENASGYYGINWFMLPKSGDVTYQLYPRDPSKQEAFKPFDPFGSTDTK